MSKRVKAVYCSACGRRRRKGEHFGDSCGASTTPFGPRCVGLLAALVPFGRRVLLTERAWSVFCKLPIAASDLIVNCWYEADLDALCVVTSTGRRFTVDRAGSPTEITKPAEASA